MKWLSTTYRIGFFLLLAAIIIFLFGGTFASTFSEAPAAGGRGRPEGEA
ncbi:hypothetical protein ABVV53_13300 [Novosphingobium sp. RD2P27]|uniref:Uncharacterized protein n=1 Tax=Novosphingobium kalidii TaxID=3230299 RepID=A0ABV2D3I3_9SPHN